MPNTFKVKTKKNIGAADSAVYTCPGGTATTIIGLNLANTTSGAITSDITLLNNDGDSCKILKTAPISVGGALVAVGGDQKLVMEAGDIIQVKSSAASSVDRLALISSSCNSDWMCSSAIFCNLFFSVANESSVLLF